MSQREVIRRKNCNTDPDIDKIVLKHLLSPERNRGASVLGFASPKEQKKGQNRIDYLRKLQKDNFDDFVA